MSGYKMKYLIIIHYIIFKPIILGLIYKMERDYNFKWDMLATVHKEGNKR